MVRHRVQRWTARLAGLGLAGLLLWGCGATDGTQTPAGQPPGADTAALPNASVAADAGPLALPRPSAVQAREASSKAVSSLLTRDGSDFVTSSCQRATASAPNAILAPDWENGYSPFDTVAYAIYRFDLHARTGQLKLFTAWEMPPGDYQLLWLGLSNWQTDRWDWYSGAPEGDPSLPVAALDTYRRPGTDEMYAAVVLLGHSAALLKRVWVECSMRGDWWMYGREPGRGANSALLGPAFPTLRWQRQTAFTDEFEHSALAPVYDYEGTLYCANLGPDQTQRQLQAIRKDGADKWRFDAAALDINNGYFAPAVDTDGTVYWPIVSGTLYAVNPEGKAKWEFAGHYSMASHPVIGADGTVYVAGNSDSAGMLKYLHAVNPDGSQRWEVELGGGPVTAPSLGPDGTVYIGSGAMLRAFTAAGAPLWSFDTGALSQCSPPVAGADGTVYVTNDDTRATLYALDNKGNIAWDFELPSASGDGVALGPEGEVYLADAGGLLYALDHAGLLRWTFRASLWRAAKKPAVDAAGVVYVASTDGRVYALNPDGTPKWWFTAQRPLADGPVIGEDNELYFFDDNARLYSIGASVDIPRYTVSGYVVDAAGAGLPGVTVAITGEAEVLTDPDGYWSKSGLGAGAYLVSPVFEDYSFTPEFQLAAVNDADLELENFVGVPAPVAEWPVWGRDGAHTRRSTHLGPALSTLKWKGFVGESIQSSPAIGADGTVYVQGEFGRLMAFTADGAQRWAYDMNHYTEACPTLGPDGSIYTHNGSSLIFAFAPGGVVRWTTEAPSVLEGTALPTADGLLLQLCDTKLLALGLDGALRWSSDAYGVSSMCGVPALGADGTIYFYSGAGLLALNPDGSDKWGKGAGAKWREGYTSPAVAEDGTIYVGSGRTMYAYNPDGTPKWEYFADSDLHASPAIGSDGALYFGTLGIPWVISGYMLALNPDGTLRWETPRVESVSSSPALDRADTVYIGTFGEGLKAYNSDGTLKWRFDVGSANIGSPAIGVDGTVYIGAQDGWIYAIGPGTP